MPKKAAAQTTASLTNTNANIIVPELTLSDYTTRKDGKVFDGRSLEALYNALKGGSANHTKFADVKNTVNGTTTYGGGSAYITGTSNSVTIPKYKNAYDLYTANSNKNIIVKFGGYDWTVTFLTTDTDGKLVATLWLADGLKDSSGDYIRSQFGYDGGTSNSFTTPSNKYSYSALRMDALNAGSANGSATSWRSSASSTTPITDAARKSHQLAKFTLDSTACPQSLIDYIDQPLKIKYQYYESFSLQYKDKSGSGNTAIILNEAISKDVYGYATGTAGAATIPTTNNSSAYSATGVWYNANLRNISNQADYNAWADDYVWAPSITETGRVSYSTSKGQVGLWGTTYTTSGSTGQAKFGSGAVNSQMDFKNVNDGHEYSWLRSGTHVSTYTSGYLSSSGVYGNALTVRSLVVRPALHLNLEAAEASALNFVEEPQNVTVDYDGSAKWLDSLETVKDSSGNFKYAWIDTSLHNNTSIVEVRSISYTSKDVLGNANAGTSSVTIADVKNAGVYTVTLNIDPSKTDYLWWDGSTGDKIFTITINQKAVPYTLQINNSTTPNITYGDTYTASLSQTAVTPASALPTTIYELWYKGVPVSVYAESKTAPTEAGSYQLTLKPAPDTAKVGSNMPSNYKLTGSALSFTIKAKEITPLTAPAPQPYNGSVQAFTVNGYDPAIMTVGKVDGGVFTATLPTGLTETTTHTFEAINAGKYTVAFQLPLDSIDGNSNRNYKWKNGTESYITVDIEVEQRTLEVDWALLSGQTNWTIPVTATGALSWNYSSIANNQPVAGEDVKLQYRFYYTSDGDSTASTPADSLDVSSIHDKNGATSRPQGSYTVQLVVADNTANGGVDGKNYKIGTSGTLVITLGAGKVDINQLIKQVATGTALPVDYDGLTDPLEYSIADGTEAVITQKFDLGWASTIDYLTLGSAFGGGAYKYEKWDGSAWVAASDTNGAGKYKVTAAIAIVSGKDYTFDTALIGTTTTKGFTVESVAADELSATVSFEVEIAQKEIDTSDFKLQYSYDQSNWKNFDTEFKTEFVDRTIYVRVNPDTMKPSVAGITAKFGTSDYATGKTKQSYNVTASFTLTDADNFKITDKAFTWEITNKQIKVDTNADWEPVDYTFDGVDYIGELMGIKGHSAYYPNIIEYEYSWYPESDPSNVKTGTGDAAAKTILITASDTNKIKVTITVKVKPSVTDYDLIGSAQTCAEFTVGSDKTPITAATSGSAVYGEITNASGFGVNVTKTDGTVIPESDSFGEIYAVYLYEYDGLSIDSSVAGAGTLLKDVDYAALNAGMYVIEVRLSASARDSYSLKNGKSMFEIERKAVELPTVGDITFTGSIINFAASLGGSYEEYKDIIEISGDLEARNVSQSGYKAYLVITDGNYKWAEPEKAPARWSLTEDGAEITITADDTAEYGWNVAPLVVDANNIWNTNGKDGASLNVPDSIKDMIASGTLAINYKYYDDAGNPVENLEKGKSYRVEAVLTGDDAGNVLFKTTSGSTTSAGLTSDKKMYTVPQSGASAFFGKAATFFKSNWLWFLIGLLVLIFLIVLICIIAHRRKTKEEREAKKEAKEEEKRRKEEEREEEKRRREQERELEKAKAEAELAKMRAGLGLGAGAAGMAMAAQQQPVQQVQQPQYVQQPVADPNALARIEAEIAAMRAEHRMQQQPQYMPQAMPMQMPMPMQMQMPMYGGQPYAQPQSAGGAMSEAEMRARIAEDRMFRSAEQRAIIAEERLRGSGGSSNITVQPTYTPAEDIQRTANSGKENNADMFGAVLASMFRSLSEGKPQKRPEALPVVQTESDNVSINTPTVYPPDAVITTTTTVDTTKPKPEVSRDTDRNFDIDGFYDTFDGKQGV